MVRYADSPTSTKTWIACPKPRASTPRARLLCLHHAGGNPSAFRPWLGEFGDDVELLAIRLPGREARLRETPLTSVPAIVEPLVNALAPLREGVRLVVFGHSLGALLGFELARAMRRAALALPDRLVVSGRNAPGVGRVLRLHVLSDRELIDEVQRVYGGIPKVLLDEPELLALTVPVLRADLTINETYEFGEEPALGCPITALGGVDDPHVSVAGLEAWAEQTTAGFEAERCAGDHFYLGAGAGKRFVLDKLRAALG